MTLAIFRDLGFGSEISEIREKYLMVYFCISNISIHERIFQLVILNQSN